jgi:mono/diheme cytochrome c family protein
LGLGGDAAAAPVPAKAEAAEPPAEAPAAAATPAPAVAPPPVAEPEPVPPFVEAALTRKKVPFWMVPVLAMLPLWALMYALTLDKPTPKEAGPLLLGAEVYGVSCASCHGGGGGGGVGPALNGGAVLAQFPNAADQLYWVMEGTAGFKELGIATYGANEVPVGSGGNMPGQKNALDAKQLIGVIRHERETLSGQAQDAESLKAEYEAIQAMIDEKYPERSEEFKAAIEEWSMLPPEL